MAVLKWILALVTGGFLLVFGITKFTGGAHIFPLIEMNASALGVPFSGLFFPLVNYATGLLELAAGVLVILPMTRKSVGAPLAVLPFFGAFLFHLSPLLGVVTPVGYASDVPELEAALKAGGPFRPEYFEGASPVLFILASVFLALALAHFILQRRAP